MTVRQQVKAQLQVSRQTRKSFKGKPKKAREWLVEMGILEKGGKKLARRYR